jgi:hypothetical protein
MKCDDDVALNCTSFTGDSTGEFVAVGFNGAAVGNTILDGALAGADAVPFVIFPTTGAGINVGPETFNGTVGAVDGAKVVAFTGAVVVGGNVETTGGLVGTLEPTIALQLGESKLAQMGVKDA